jgi:hypothetical protein
MTVNELLRGLERLKVEYVTFKDGGCHPAAMWDDIWALMRRFKAETEVGDEGALRCQLVTARQEVERLKSDIEVSESLLGATMEARDKVQAELADVKDRLEVAIAERDALSQELEEARGDCRCEPDADPESDESDRPIVTLGDLIDRWVEARETHKSLWQGCQSIEARLCQEVDRRTGPVIHRGTLYKVGCGHIIPISVLDADLIELEAGHPAD